VPVPIILQGINAFPVLKAMIYLKLTGIVIIYYQDHSAEPLGMYVSCNEHLVKIPKQVLNKLVSELKEVSWH